MSSIPNDEEQRNASDSMPPALKAEPVAANSDLGGINRIVTAAIESWGLPERVRRLALPSLLYDEVDLEAMDVALLHANDRAVAVAIWEAVGGKDDVDGSDKCWALLHGLYVVSGSQRRGLGSVVLELAERRMLAEGFARITVRAWRDSKGFFTRRGFLPFDRDDAPETYPVRMWKALT